MEYSDSIARTLKELEAGYEVEKEVSTSVDPDASREDRVKAAQLAARWEKRRKDDYDDYGAEMGKDARVWQLYVKETNRVDEEMVKGWNDSLDVLLLFAALFSAISTAFVATSSQTLQRDPADTSAQTLLVISQTLLSISNGQTTSLSAPVAEDTPGFSPPPIAVVINTLWFLSLSLSVAVSLIAMLAKEWSRAFLSGRSGETYNRGRLRQKRWNEIERLKMIDAMTFLPILMHLALLLFAIGLCVFLWDISIPVAIPVIMVTSICLAVYITTTVHSLTSEHCLYTTASSKVVKSYFEALLKLFGPFYNSWRKPVANYIDSRLTQAAKYLETWALRIKSWAHIVNKSMPWGKEANSVDLEAAQTTTHMVIEDERSVYDESMDLTTSQMIAWIIKHCEDSESSGIAIRALAGAEPWLPRLPLLESGGLETAFQHLDRHFEYNPSQGTCSLKPAENPELPSLYLRALHFLLSKHNGEGFSKEDGRMKDSWGRNFYPNDFPGMAAGLQTGWWVHGRCTEASVNLTLAMFRVMHRVNFSSNEASIAAFWSSFPLEVPSPDDLFASMLYHYHLRYSDGLLAIKQHMAGEVVLHHAALIALVRNVTRRLCLPQSYWKDLPATHLRLCAVLVRLYAHLDLFDRKAELGLSVALGIAASAFTFGSYPSGTLPNRGGATDSRAEEFVAYHQPPQIMSHHGQKLSASVSRRAVIEKLLGFGLLGLFEHPSAQTLTGKDLKAWKNSYMQLQDAYEVDELNLYSIPRAFNFREHAARVLSGCLQKRLFHDDFKQYQADWVSCYTTLYSESIPGFIDAEEVHGILHPVLLSRLCTTESPVEQRICLGLLESSRWCNQTCLKVLPSNTLKALLDTSLSGNTRIAPTAMYHLWVLTQDILYLEDQSPATLLLLTSLYPTNSPAPRDEIETWLIQQLYPDILMMCRDAPRELYDNGVLSRIYADLVYGRETTVDDNHGVTGTGDRTLSVDYSTFRELRDQNSSAIDAENQRWKELPYFPSEEQSKN